MRGSMLVSDEKRCMAREVLGSEALGSDVLSSEALGLDLLG